MAWFRRNKPKIEEQSDEEERKVRTEGIFIKCPECENPLYRRELRESHHVCTHCDYHFRLGGRERLDELFDDGKYEKLDEEITSGDPLDFVDTKPYKVRIEAACRNLARGVVWRDAGVKGSKGASGATRAAPVSVR